MEEYQHDNVEVINPLKQGLKQALWYIVTTSFSSRSDKSIKTRIETNLLLG